MSVFAQIGWEARRVCLVRANECDCVGTPWGAYISGRPVDATADSACSLTTF